MPSADEFTLGVEEEFLLVDPDTRRLVPRAEEVLDDARADGDAKVEHELQLVQVEAGTAVCGTLSELRGQVAGLRKTLSASAERAGCRIASSGSHPFSPCEDSRVTPKPAYLRLERDYQLVTREQLVCGCHIHVGVADADMAIRVMNRVRPWLPTVLAIAVNSPFWLGTDTGYASFRTEIWRRWPMAGTPDIFASRAEYDELVELMLKTGAIDDPARIYWDIRPSARFDTLEFRVTDACLSVDETVMVAGLFRALARTARDEEVAGRPLRRARSEMLEAAIWRAARYGVEGELIDLPGGRSLPAPEVVRDLLVRLRPVLEDIGDWDDVSGLVERVLEGGTGAARQRRSFARREELTDVVDMIVAETVAG
ncbi:MAG TPA: glutamate--cysteine ligase [Acidimicrobiales bacterium]|nr:glutamate--cysteine ligase [Acidimicrobiales bacterium]